MATEKCYRVLYFPSDESETGLKIQVNNWNDPVKDMVINAIKRVDKGFYYAFIKAENTYEALNIFWNLYNDMMLEVV